MLIECPECERRVSDRAKACPDCGFPVAEETEAAAARERDRLERKSRKLAGEVDCPFCAARGFRSSKDPETGAELFQWCAVCERSGRVPLVHSTSGYHAVGFDAVDAFLAGDEVDAEDARALGMKAPPPFLYPKAGKRIKGDQVRMTQGDAGTGAKPAADEASGDAPSD